MATTFQNDTIWEGNNKIVVHLQGYGDTDQTDVQVLDLSTIVFPDNRQAGHLGVAGADMFQLQEATWSVVGWAYVQLNWDATANDEMITMSGDGSVNLVGVGGKNDPQSAGTTGDVLLSSVGATDANSSYNITLVFKKKEG